MAHSEPLLPYRLDSSEETVHSPRKRKKEFGDEDHTDLSPHGLPTSNGHGSDRRLRRSHEACSRSGAEFIDMFAFHSAIFYQRRCRSKKIKVGDFGKSRTMLRLPIYSSATQNGQAALLAIPPGLSAPKKIVIGRR